MWSMGVLLYALLCGCLPFDDSSNNMAVIYRKIQSGRFAVPKWLSVDSVDLLHDLMQVNPRRRVTVRELVRHPWVVKGFNVPVSWHSNCQVTPLTSWIIIFIKFYWFIVIGLLCLVVKTCCCDVPGSVLTHSTINNLLQVANLLCSWRNSASCPR